MLIRPAGGKRISRTVPTEREAIDLVRYFNRLGLAGLDISGALQQATVRAAPAPTCPPIRDALPAFLAHQVEVGEIRASTAAAYRNRLAVWAYPLIGDVPWDRVTREQIGAILLKIRAAKKSMAVLEGIRCPLTRFYQWQANLNGYRGVNPAADLRFFIGKLSRRARTDLEWFRRDEAAALLEACQALKPRWAAFLLVCFTGGLRWGEATALHVSDIDWNRSRLHVQRTWSEDGGRIEATKDGEDRWVKLPASALQALRAHVEAMALEAQLHRWTHEQRLLVFPNSMGKVTRYGAFSEHVW